MFSLAYLFPGRFFCKDLCSGSWGNNQGGGQASFAPTDMVGPDQGGRRRDRERSDLMVKMTRGVEDMGLLRPGVAAIF